MGMRSSLQLINLSYDLVPANLISAIVMQTSVIPATSVPSILRERDIVKLQ